MKICSLAVFQFLQFSRSRILSKTNFNLFHTSVLRLEEMKLQEIVSKLNKIAPLNLAESWDNVGLLVEPYTKKGYNKIILTNDLTEDVLQECIEFEADFILSYHPPVFRPLKCITQKHWKERIVSRCLESGIAVYSPHTAHDALAGGVNDWLVGAFGEAKITPVTRSSVPPKFDHEITFITIADKDWLLDILNKMKDQSRDKTEVMVNDYSLCAYVAKPALQACLEYLDQIFPIKNYVVKTCDKNLHPNQGMGRLALLSSEVAISDVIDKLKTMTGLSHIRVGLGCNQKLSTRVKKGAVCAGSGSSVLRGVAADVIITGEMGHHEILEFTQSNKTVILLEHSNSERGYLSAVLKPKLEMMFGSQLKVMVSKQDKDPMTIM